MAAAGAPETLCVAVVHIEGQEPVRQGLVVQRVLGGAPLSEQDQAVAQGIEQISLADGPPLVQAENCPP